MDPGDLIDRVDDGTIVATRPRWADRRRPEPAAGVGDGDGGALADRPVRRRRRRDPATDRVEEVGQRVQRSADGRADGAPFVGRPEGDRGDGVATTPAMPHPARRSASGAARSETVALSTKASVRATPEAVK